MRFLALMLAGLLFLSSCLLLRAETIVVPCELYADADVQVPAQEDGVLLKIAVREGQQVVKNDLLAQIDDIIPQMQYNVNYYKLKVAEKQALDDVDVQYARAGYDVAVAKLQRSLRSIAITPKSVADDTIDEQRLEKEKFRLSIEKAQKDLQVAVLQ